MHYLVTANINIEPRLAGMFRGYEPGDHVAVVGYFDVEAETHAEAAEIMFAIGNRQQPDAKGQTWPSTVRSLSKGDLLYVADDHDHKILAVEGVGWREVPLPTADRSTTTIPDGGVR